MANAVPAKVLVSDQNDQIIEIDGLKNALTDAYMNDATVIASLFDSFGNPVAGATALSLNPVSASGTGVYRGILPATVNVPVGTGYVLKLDIQDSSQTYKAHLEISAEVITRRT